MAQREPRPEDDQAAVDETVERFSLTFGEAVGRDAVREVVETSYQRFETARVRDFVPVLVERDVRRELHELVEAP